MVRMSVTMKKSPSRVTICCKQGDLPFFLQQYCIYENDQILYSQQSPTFLARGTCFVEYTFSMDEGRGGGGGEEMV